MSTESSNIKEEVRQFYNDIGWQLEDDGYYQNARYEDLRPVSAEYIHRCHLRVGKYLRGSGRNLLDLGSGPIQYPEYLTYSRGYQHRVCVDISSVALKEARAKIGDRGFFVVADAANLPFKAGAFDGIVSLHTFHHLPEHEQLQAYDEVYRTLTANSSAVVVNGWTESRFMNRMAWLEKLNERVIHFWKKHIKREIPLENKPVKKKKNQIEKATGTYITKLDANWLKQALDGKMSYEIRVWRSASVRFMRSVIHPRAGGKFWLKVLYRLEEWFPHYFGEHGQYPMVIIQKS